MLPSSAGSGRSSENSSRTGRPGRFFSWLETRVAPYAHRIGDAPAALALRQALPWSFIGLAVGLAIFGYTGHGTLVQRIVAAIPGGFAITSVVLVVLLAFALARRLSLRAAILVPATIAAFALTLPSPHGATIDLYAHTLGASGLFLAILVGLATAAALSWGRRRYGDPRGQIAGAVLALAVASVLFAFHVSLAALLAEAIEPLGALGDSFFALAVITFVECALWVVGIHGPALLAAIVTPIYLKLQAANLEAFSHDHPLPHIVTVSTFLFVFPGGAGATLPLALLFARSRVPRLRRIGLASIIPGILNTNEPLILGVPIVFSPILAVPFIVAPTILAITSYAAIATGLVGRPVYYIPSTVPTLISVVLATRDWRAAVLAALNIAIAFAIWLPFVRMYERTQMPKT